MLKKLKLAPPFYLVFIPGEIDKKTSKNEIFPYCKGITQE